MVNKFCFDGVRPRVSKKSGKNYYEVFLRQVDDSGNIGIEQVKFLSFDDAVGLECKKFKFGSIIDVNLKIKDATIVGVREANYEL